MTNRYNKPNPLSYYLLTAFAILSPWISGFQCPDVSEASTGAKENLWGSQKNKVEQIILTEHEAKAVPSEFSVLSSDAIQFRSAPLISFEGNSGGDALK